VRRDRPADEDREARVAPRPDQPQPLVREDAAIVELTQDARAHERVELALERALERVEATAARGERSARHDQVDVWLQVEQVPGELERRDATRPDRLVRERGHELAQAMPSSANTAKNIGTCSVKPSASE